LFLVWQPQFELISGGISGAEALVRWRDPETNEEIEAAEFIPAAEKSGLILEIDRFVLKKACIQAAAWSAVAHKDFIFSVNISAKHLQRPELPEFVRRTLEESGLEPGRLELEITESAFIENKQLALGVLQGLRALGVRTALDDFGTGYSSLSYLVDLNVSRIKIDRSFMTDFRSSAEKRIVVRLIIALAHSLELDVVAEGVETAEQTVFLMRLKCRYAQGFLLSRPVSAEEMTRGFLERDRGAPGLIEAARRILAA
jgi:EAL domain-containing protein (putative c-di-GMP-specific phosphodiesterase class I)